MDANSNPPAHHASLDRQRGFVRQNTRPSGPGCRWEHWRTSEDWRLLPGPGATAQLAKALRSDASRPSTTGSS